VARGEVRRGDERGGKNKEMLGNQIEKTRRTMSRSKLKNIDLECKWRRGNKRGEKRRENLF